MSKRIVMTATAVQLAREAGISKPTLYQWREAFLKGGFSSLDGRQGTDPDRRRYPDVVRSCRQRWIS